MRETFGQLLQEARDLRGLKTQGELRDFLAARGLNVSEKTISAWERGGTTGRRPNRKHFAKLCEALEWDQHTRARAMSLLLDEAQAGETA